jgi:hypothetical protein
VPLHLTSIDAILVAIGVVIEEMILCQSQSQ